MAHDLAVAPAQVHPKHAAIPAAGVRCMAPQACSYTRRLVGRGAHLASSARMSLASALTSSEALQRPTVWPNQSGQQYPVSAVRRAVLQMVAVRARLSA